MQSTPNRLLVKYSICMCYTLMSYKGNVPWFDIPDKPAFFAVVDFLGLGFGFGSSSSSDKRPAKGSSSSNSVRYNVVVINTQSLNTVIFSPASSYEKCIHLLSVVITCSQLNSGVSSLGSITKQLGHCTMFLARNLTLKVQNN